MKLTTIPALLAVLAFACSTNGENESHAATPETGEHGEESGVELARSETYDATRHGVRLILAYDEAEGSFKGTTRPREDGGEHGHEHD